MGTDNEKLYYIRNEGYVGNALVWWAENSKGYTTDIRKAGKYTFEEAEYDHIQNILSTEVSIYLTRRTSGCCGSIIDNLRGLRRQFIYEYEQKFKKQFIDYNSEVDF